MKKVLLTIVGLTMLWGCQSIDYLSIDYLLPAEMSFPNQLRKVAVVNNMPLEAPITLNRQFTDMPDINARLQYHKTKYYSGDSKCLLAFFFVTCSQSRVTDNYSIEIITISQSLCQ